MKKTKNITGKAIPFFNFVSQHQQLRGEFKKCIDEIINNNIYILGSNVASLENRLAKYLGIKHAVGVATGTDALELAIKGLGLTAKDEVIVPANAYPTVWGVIAGGTKVNIVDVDPNTLQIDINHLKKIVNKDTKAVVVVHLYGLDMLSDQLRIFLRKNKIFIIEDCAQSFGAKTKDKMVGSRGDIATLSFYPTKPLGALGDGGMILANSKKIIDTIKMLRMYGEKNRYQSLMVGTNSRLDELQAAFLLKKLIHVNQWNKERQRIVEFYRKNISTNTNIQFVQNENWKSSSHHLFPLLASNKSSLEKYLAEKGIQTNCHYPLSLSKVESLQHMKFHKTPVAESIAQQLISLPLYNGLKVADVKTIVKEINNWSSKK